MGRPFDAAGDLAAIATDHDLARIGGRSFFGVFQGETTDGDPRGGAYFTTAEPNIFDEDLSRDVTQQTLISIQPRGRAWTDYYIDGREPDGRGVVRLLLTPV